jgi:hypothetical protein
MVAVWLHAVFLLVFEYTGKRLLLATFKNRKMGKNLCGTRSLLIAFK